MPENPYQQTVPGSDAGYAPVSGVQLIKQLWRCLFGRHSWIILQNEESGRQLQICEGCMKSFWRKG